MLKTKFKKKTMKSNYPIASSTPILFSRSKYVFACVSSSIDFFTLSMSYCNQ